MTSKDSFVAASKILDDNIKSWILEIASSGIIYQDLMSLAAPKFRLDYITSLITELHNENKILFSSDNDDELISVTPLPKSD